MAGKKPKITPCVAAGPTSRLDTIVLRGFDEKVFSPEKAFSDGNANQLMSGGKHHYEHIVAGAKRSTSSGDMDNVPTSNGNSPSPARSTPTKSVCEKEST